MGGRREESRGTEVVGAIGTGDGLNEGKREVKVSSSFLAEQSVPRLGGACLRKGDQLAKLPRRWLATIFGMWGGRSEQENDLGIHLTVPGFYGARNLRANNKVAFGAGREGRVWPFTLGLQRAKKRNSGSVPQINKYVSRTS